MSCQVLCRLSFDRSFILTIAVCEGVISAHRQTWADIEANPDERFFSMTKAGPKNSPNPIRFSPGDCMQQGKLLQQFALSIFTNGQVTESNAS